MVNYPTPHIDAKPEDFAETVLMPGDPLRSKRIAENFLGDPVLVNNVRGIQGYTGTYKGRKVSVMASGMGIPSIGIYSFELFNFFGVKNIIRVGSAGAMQTNIKIHDIVIGMGASTTSHYADQFHLPGAFAPVCSFELLEKCIENAKKLGLTYHVGNLLSSDTYYNDDDGAPEGKRFFTLGAWQKMGVLAVEMEAAGLYLNAARAGKNALAICTVSDHILTGENTTSLERQNSFNDMISLALETAIEL